MKRSQASNRRLRYLVGALLACGAALPLTRLALLQRPAPPPTAASVSAQRDYWRNRIKQNVADVDAYVRLGILEEQAGFYTAAAKYLRAARALGAPDAVICGPLGRALTRLARDDEALPELEKAAKLAPRSVDAVANLAGLYVAQHEPKMAAEVLKRFANAHRSALNAGEAEYLALCFMECGDNSAARKAAERSLELDSGGMVARSVAARAALGDKDLGTARRHLEAVLKKAPDDPGVLYLYGLVLEAQGNPEAALKQWKQTVARNPNALDAFEKIGDVYARRGDLRRAAKAYETVAQRAPSAMSALRTAAALNHVGDAPRAAYWKAVGAGFQGDFKTALRLGKVAAAHPATNYLGLQAMAEAYRGMHQKEPYIATMRKLTARGTVDDLLLMAKAWGEVDESAKRTEYLKRALVKAPQERQAAIHGELASAYRRRGMRDEAERELEQALQKSPRDPELHRELAGVYFERRTLGGRLERAIRAWETAISLDPTNETDWQQLGRAYEAAGHLPRAVACLEHAVDLEPGHGSAYLELGRAYARLGDKSASKYMMGLYTKFVAYDQQRQTLRTRARRKQASAEDLIAYGDFMRKAGYISEAVPHYEKALSLRPNDARLKAKLDALNGRTRRTSL